MDKKGILKTGIIIVAIIIATIYFYKTPTCENTSNLKTENLAKEKEAPKTLFFGITPSHPLQNMAEIYQKLAGYLEYELEIPVELVFRSSYSEIIDTLAKGEIDVCLISTFAYIVAYEKTKIFPLVRMIEYGSSDYNSIIITRKDSGIMKLEDLEGKKFAFTDKLSTSGYLLPNVMMKKKEILNPHNYFSEVIFTASHESSLEEVYNGKVDAAAITTTCWNDPDPDQTAKRQDLKIIWESETVPFGPFCVRDDLDKELAEKIEKALLKIGKTEDTREISMQLKTKGGIEGFEEAKDNDYDIVRKAYASIRKVTIGFMPSHYRPKMIKVYQKMEPYLQKELEIPVEVVTRSNYGEIIDALVNSEVDVCLLGSFAYILASKETKISPLVRRIKYGSSFYHSIIIVRKDSGISNFDGLEGRKFAFTDKKSTSGYLLPFALMKGRGIQDPEKYFFEVIFTGYNESALEDVYKKVVDGAAISTTCWYDPDPVQEAKKNDLKIIWKSKAVPLGPFCVRDDLDKELAQKIKKAFLKIGKTEDTILLSGEIEGGLGIQGFEEARDNDYEIIRKEYEAIR